MNDDGRMRRERHRPQRPWRPALLADEPAHESRPWMKGKGCIRYIRAASMEARGQDRGLIRPRAGQTQLKRRRSVTSIWTSRPSCTVSWMAPKRMRLSASTTVSSGAGEGVSEGSRGRLLTLLDTADDSRFPSTERYNSTLKVDKLRNRLPRQSGAFVRRIAADRWNGLQGRKSFSSRQRLEHQSARHKPLACTRRKTPGPAACRDRRPPSASARRSS